MENSEQSEVLFPSEDEIKSYFPDDVWNTMADYERRSYRNMLHNYNVMKSLDLKPIKPSFMTLYRKKASKRKATSNLCRVPAKKPQSTKETSLKKGKEIKEQRMTNHQKTNRQKIDQQKTEYRKTNLQKIDQQKTEQQKKASVMFDSSHKWQSIGLHCVFAAVFKVYKRYHGIIKCHYRKKRKTMKVSKKYLKKNVEKNMEERVNDGVVNVQDVNVGAGNSVQECSNDKFADVATNAKESLEENKIPTDVKVEECAKPSVRSTAPKTKPVCRSVQTMTAAEGCSPSTSALVFVNAASSKKTSISFPDPKPLTPQEQKRMKKINQERMKNRRNVQTQTAAEDSSIEEAKLVFFPVRKLKKPKPKAAPTQADNDKKEELMETETQQDGIAVENPNSNQSVVPTQTDNDKKEELLKTETQQDGIAVENPDGNQSVVCPSPTPTESEEIAKPSGNDEKEKYNDTSSEDEFGFYALFKQENDAKTKSSLPDKPNIPETKPQPGVSDLAVPDCSGLQTGPLKSWSTNKRIAQKPGSCKTTESSDEDEFGFFQLEKDANAKKNVASKPNIPKTKAQPKDTDLAVPGCSSQSPERRYPRRALPVIDYTEGELLQDDEYLFCDLCDREHEGDCPEHGPHKYFPDRFVPITGDGDRAIQTAPAMLKIDKSKIPGAGSGVWTMSGLPPHVRFGPYQGDETSEPDPLGYSWAIVKDKRVDHYIAAQSTATSNWMRFVNCARHETEQNLMAFQYKGQMYYRTVKLIPPKAELFVWYGKEYAEQLGISMESFRSKDTSHLRNLVFSCDECNVTYTSPLYLEVHKKNCRGKRVVAIVEPSRVPTDVQSLAVIVDGRKTYFCNLCNFKTALCGNIRNHLVTHSGEKPHVCDVCSKGFSRASDLDRHKLIHAGVKLFKCEQCSYSCNRMSHLRQHMTRHTGEKAFACLQCEYKTADSSNMERHSRTHSGDKPYCCTLCPYRAAESGHLTTHMRTHTGEKPYACPHCEYRAVRKGHLNKHIARLHSAQK